MSRNLSQIVADLFAKSTGGEDPAARIQRLRDEIKKGVESEDSVFGKLHGLLESLREIIPDEKQRYLAALKALSTTSKMGPQEIVKAISGQLDELKVLEKGVMPATNEWRDELQALEARLAESKGEVEKLREKIAQLESEEKTVHAAMSTRKKELELAEAAVRDLFADIREEILFIQKKIENVTAVAPAAQSGAITEAAPLPVPVTGKSAGKQKAAVPEDKPEPTPQVDSKFQRKCPMCGGQFHLHELEKKWQCYTCAFEEDSDGGGVKADVDDIRL